MSPRPSTEHHRKIDGVETHWWEFDSTPDSPTIVMFHGFRGDHHGLQLITDALPEFRVLIPDLPAFGATEAWAGGVTSIDDYGRWLRAFLVATETTHAVVVGHSFGSIVVSNGLRGKRTEPIVLINPISMKALSGPRKFLAGIAGLWYTVGGALPVTLGNAWLSKPLFVRVMSGLMAKTKDPELLNWIHGQHAAYFSSYSDRDALVASFEVSTSTTVADFAAEIDAPVLLVAADEDDITPIAAQHEVQRLFPSAELVVLSGVGHLVHYEKPIETADAIRRFLAVQS
jgi:pimeloyl-ACP methyl ester carboxylesterase